MNEPLVFEIPVKLSTVVVDGKRYWMPFDACAWWGATLGLSNSKNVGHGICYGIDSCSRGKVLIVDNFCFCDMEEPTYYA